MPTHFLPALLPLLAWQTQAFVVAPLSRPSADARAPHVASSRPRSAPRRLPATVEDTAVGALAVTAEEWDGFGKEDYARFLSEFWQKKPLLIRQAVKG